MTRPLTKPEIKSLAADMVLLLSKVESEELKASLATRMRIEGAITALRVVLGDSEPTALDIANDPLL
jgi:hypothetical protein